MHKLYELKDMLCKELEKYGSKNELTAGSLDVVDKLAHAVKNIDKILEADGGEYSGDSMPYMRGGNRSYARGRGQNARRDALGRYSREGSYGYSMAGDMAVELRELMQDAPDAQTRQDIQRIVDRLSQM
jgi:hypothetical protein